LGVFFPETFAGAKVSHVACARRVFSTSNAKEDQRRRLHRRQHSTTNADEERVARAALALKEFRTACAEIDDE
jgi:hypothetical protein